jgi:hypothetical protein
MISLETLNKIIEESETIGYNYGTSPWDYLIEEAAKEVNSDDEIPDPDSKEDTNSEETGEDGETEEIGGDGEEGDGEGLLSDEELMQLAQELQSPENAENMDEMVKKLLDDGTINQTDIEKLGQIMQQEPSPEEERQVQINNIQEMVIRFNIYDKLNNLETKLEVFIENFPNIDEEFYKDVEQIHAYIKVINTLIFNLEINLVYQLFANLEMKLIELFTEYKNKNNIKDS